MEFPPSLRTDLCERFRDHCYYRLCCQVHEVFLSLDSSVNISKEQLFADAAVTLDRLLQEEHKEEQCQNLWSDMQEEYRRREGSRTTQTTTQAEVAMLYYAVMFGLAAVNHSYYRSTLLRALHLRVHRMWKDTHCKDAERRLTGAVNPLSEGLRTWMAEYFSSGGSLTKEIASIVNPERGKQGSERRAEAGEPAIPEDCRAAVDKVFTDRFTVKERNGVTFNSRRQVVKAAAVVTLESSPMLAMLMAVGMEVGAVKGGCSCIDFVRALIGLRVLRFTDEQALKNKATAMSRKLNGRARNGTPPRRLAASHKQWDTKDQEVGNRIYRAMQAEQDE